MLEGQEKVYCSHYRKHDMSLPKSLKMWMKIMVCI